MDGDALIGHTGFIGGLLKKERLFDYLYNRANAHEMRGKKFRRVYCCAMPGTKWLANKEPVRDSLSLLALIENLSQIDVEEFVLISTVDVYGDPRGVDEGHEPIPNSTYGTNRLLLEVFVKQYFKRSLVVRLPGIVGPGAYKGPLYDVKVGKPEALCPSSLYQWYPGSRLSTDINGLLYQGVSLAHLVSPPIPIGATVPEVASQMLGKDRVWYCVRTALTDSGWWCSFPANEIREYLK